jgi:MoxR-like ATPase
MEERQVTVDGAGFPVPQPFMVIATQNPIDLGGTYRLPEAQLDRFLLRLRLGYPDTHTESALLADDTGYGRRAASQVTDLAEVQQMIETVRAVHAAPAVCDYIVAITDATRKRSEIRLGASPRASQALLRAAKAAAAADARSYVVPDDVKPLVAAVLAHRLVLMPDAEVAGRHAEDVLAGILDSVQVPAVGG